MAEFFDQLPDPKLFSGKIAADTQTGQRFKSDGTTWIDITNEEPGAFEQSRTPSVVAGPQTLAPGEKLPRGFALKGNTREITPIPEEFGPSPAQQVLRGAISAASILPAMAIPGAGPGATLLRAGAEALFPAVAETIMQKTGIAPESTEDIAAAALTPITTRGLLGFPGVVRGGIRGAANFTFPQEVRDVGTEMFRRRFLGGPTSKTLFKEARKVGSVSKAPIVKAVDKAIITEQRMSTPTLGAVKILNNLKTKLSRGSPTMSYARLISEVQRLGQAAESHFKRGNNVTGVTLSKARSAILKEMDKISPAIKQANTAFRRESSVKAITKELRKSNPSVGVQTLLETDDLVAGSFSAIEQKEIIDLAKRIGRSATGATLGAANRFIMAAAEPVAEAIQEPRGRALLEILMRNPRSPVWVNRWGAIIVAEFGRGGFARFGSESSEIPTRSVPQSIDREQQRLIAPIPTSIRNTK